MRSARHRSEIIDEEIDSRPPTPWATMALYFFGLFAFVPLTYALHQCGLDWGARYYAPSTMMRLLEGLVLTVMVVQMVCVWPLTTFVYPEIVERRELGLTGLVLGSVLLFAPPLSAFACFWGDIKELNDAYEVCLNVLPALVAAIVIYWKSQRTWTLTLFLSLALFVPIFLMGDLLSPFRLLIAYSSRGPGFYWYRTFFPVLVMAMALASPDRARFGLRRFRREAGLLFLALVASVVTLRLAFPMVVALREGSPLMAFVQWDLSWFFYLPMMAFVSSPQRTRYWLALAAAAAGALSALLHLAVRPLTQEPSLWQISSFAQELVVLVLLARIATELGKAPWRSSFPSLVQPTSHSA